MSDQIKIVFFTGELGLGGSEHQLFLLLSHIDHTRFGCHIIVFNPSNYFMFNSELEEMGIRVEAIPPHVRSIPRRMWYLFKRLRTLRPDIVHSWTIHDNPYAGVVGWLAGIRARYGSLRNSLSLPGTSNLPAIYKFLAFHTIQRLFINADSIAREMQAKSYPDKRLCHLPNCVDLKRYRRSVDVTPSLHDEFDLSADTHIVGIVGNLRRVKNHHLFIKALANVLADRSDVVGIIVGQPMPHEQELPHELEVLADELNLRDHIIFAGFRRDVPELLSQMDVLCMTSHTEGLPNAILEAMAVGCPVVSVRVGGVEELVANNATGLLVQPDDSIGLAKAINLLLDDADLAHSLSTQARQFVEAQHDCNTVVNQLEHIYEKVVTHARA